MQAVQKFWGVRTKLVPNYYLAVFKVSATIGLVIGLAALLDYSTRGTWWSRGYTVTMAVPICLVPIFALMLFVPRYIILDHEGLRIKYMLRKERCVLFENIKAFGRGKKIFLIQPGSGPTLQIFGHSFRTDDWRDFMRMVELNCPDKNTGFWLGPKAVK